MRTEAFRKRNVATPTRSSRNSPRSDFTNNIDLSGQTPGDLLPEGSSLELVRDDQDSHPMLAVIDAQHEVASRWALQGPFQPHGRHGSILEALTLPSRCLPYGSTRELFEKTSDRISQVARLPKIAVVAITCFVFATWLVDFLPVAPLLWIVVPPTASADALRQLLVLLCRRALPFAELNMVALRSLPACLVSTVVADVPRITPDLIRALRVSSRRNAYILGRDGVADLSCARVVFANVPLRDPAMLGFPLEIALPPATAYVPPLTPDKAYLTAAEFQGRFLEYRLTNLGKFAPPKLDLGEATAPTREQAYSLLASVVGDDELQSRLIPLLQEHDREIQVDRASQLESIALEALLAGPKSGILPLGDLTQSVNTILAGRGELRQVSPEDVGWKLKALGFRTRFIAGGRKGLELTRETRSRIRAQAEAYGVRTLQQGRVETDGAASTGAQQEPRTKQARKHPTNRSSSTVRG